VLRVVEREIERVHLNVCVLDVGDGRLVFLRRREVRGGGEALADEEHVRDARVRELREAGFLTESERDVTHVGLDVSVDVSDHEAMSTGDNMTHRA
jgi:hypothetical protein